MPSCLAEVRGKAIEPDQRRIADAFENGRAERFDGGDHELHLRCDCSQSQIEARPRICDS